MDKTAEKLDLKLIKQDIMREIRECSARGLNQSAKWLSELNFAITAVKISPEEPPNPIKEFGEEYDSYLMAKSYFDLKEYDRCVYFTEKCTTAKAHFLHLYARYLSIEKKKLDNMTDTNCPPDPTKNDALRELRGVFVSEQAQGELDGYSLYLYGVVLKKLDLASEAIQAFLDAVKANPVHWGAWQELSLLIPDKAVLKHLEKSLPDCWMRLFFMSNIYLEQLNNDAALDIYDYLNSQGFQRSTYIMAQMAIAFHNRRELDKAITTFKDLLEIDPYRLDNLDTYSNLLYVREQKTDLADLAHTAITIDKYRVETCCVIGNYYSLRSEHAKAVLYFQRALKLNPQYLSAWTLMGHEYMEMKNTNAAIQSYRQALEVNRRDYRAWYGLGQTYEILKMPVYCMYYYKQAQQLRPNDSRMIVALGETYEKMDKIENALKCYYKACNVGDVEGIALVKLAKLYSQLDETDNAAAAYTEYCLKEEVNNQSENQSELYSAFLYLAYYHVKKGNLGEAYTCAFKCLDHEETKEQAKALMKTIASCRKVSDVEASPLSEVNVSDLISEASTSNVDMELSYS